MQFRLTNFSSEVFDFLAFLTLWTPPFTPNKPPPTDKHPTIPPLSPCNIWKQNLVVTKLASMSLTNLLE